MKKKLLVMLLVTIYAIQLLLLYILSPFLRFIKTTSPPISASKYILIILLVLSFVFIIMNIVTAFLGLRHSKISAQKTPFGTIMGFKLAFIPFFISHAYWFLLTMGGTANPFLFVLWLVIPFLFLFYAYLVLFATSSYLIVQIYKMGKRGTFTKGQCALHIVMQLLFVIDVIDSVYLFFKYRKLSE